MAGSEVAVKIAAGAALQDTFDITSVPYPDIKPHIRQHLRKIRQMHWSEHTEQTARNKTTLGTIHYPHTQQIHKSCLCSATDRAHMQHLRICSRGPQDICAAGAETPYP